MKETLNTNILAVTRCYFGGGGPKSPPPPPRPPERGDAAKLVRERNQSVSRQGRSSTILGGASPNISYEGQKKTLLGS
jgi:hypothetical protein